MKAKYDKKIGEAIDRVSHKWDVSGGFAFFKGDQCLYQNCYGYASRNEGQRTTTDSSYIMHLENPLFSGLAIMKLVEGGRLKLSHKLSLYIPEYKHASKITIMHMMKDLSGIPDFYYSNTMVALQKSADHNNLPTQQRLQAEHAAFYQNANFDFVMAYIQGQDLEYKPGTKDRDSSLSNWILLAEVVRRVSQKSMFDYLSENVFKPFGMMGVRLGTDANTASYVVHREQELVPIELQGHYKEDAFFTMTLDDAIQFLKAISSRRLFTEAIWDLVLKYDHNMNGLIFENANGYDCTNASFLGYSLNPYVNFTNGISFVAINNEAQKMAFENNSWHYFRRDCREAIDGLMTMPINTKMEPLKKSNYWNAMNIMVGADQQEFVLDAKSSVAMALMYTTKKAFVQMEGHQTVGLLVVEVDKKKDYFHIDIIQIDQRFQGKGYGKLMVKWAVDYLAQQGAKELKIGVNRYNYGAQKIYMAAGFEPKQVYDEGMELHLTL